MTQHSEPTDPIPSHSVGPAGPDLTEPDSSGETQVTLRGPADLADALPYLLGFYPDDSVVLVALYGERGRFGGRVRLGIPADRTQWSYVSGQLAGCLVSAGEQRGARPEGILVFLCQEPSAGESGRDVMERLRPFAQLLRTACGGLDVPVLEALCIANGRFWSYCCPDYRCCPAEGTPLVLPGTSVMAAAAAYTGLQVRGSLREMEARLAPLTGPRAARQEKALDAAAAALVPRMLAEQGARSVRAQTLDLAGRMIRRFRDDVPSGSLRARDACDDALITDGEAAELILGLQDRPARDSAAQWMDGEYADPALRLWRALARRCAGGYVEHAVPALTLAGWVAWSSADGPTARVALARALSLDPDYLFAQLLHRGINDGLDPEPLRRCLREGVQEDAVALRGEGQQPAGAPRADCVPGPGKPDKGAAAGPDRGPRTGSQRPAGSGGPRGRARAAARGEGARGRRRGSRDGGRSPR